MSARRRWKRFGLRWLLSAAVPAGLAGSLLVVTSLPGSPGPAAGPGTRVAGSPTAGAVTMDHMVMPTAAASVPDAPTLQPEGWTVAASDQQAGHPASAVLDSDPATYWSSRPSSSAAALPQSVTVDMRGTQTVSGLAYQPRQGARPDGVIGQFAVSVSADGVHFSTVASGTWANTTATKQVGIAPVRTRFVRLTALSFAAGAAGPGSSVSAAGISLMGAPGVESAAVKNAPKAQKLSTNPSVVGKWGPTIGFPLVPSAVALLPGNKLLAWSADQNLAFGNGTKSVTQTAILNLTTGKVTQVTISNTHHDMFCPGVAILANGDIMVTGGLSNRQTSIYHPATNSWTAGPQMNVGRGYQGMTLLPDGQAFVLGGSWSGALGGKLGEVWSPTGGWRELPGVPATPMYTADPQGVYRADNHGWFIATSGGRVFQAGPSKQMNWITTSGPGSITPAGLRGTSADAMNGNAVSYDVGKVITMGGAPAYENSTATNRAYEIDISTASAKVTQVGSMNYPRAFANSVVLPDGNVVTVGGQTYAVPFSDRDSVLNAELWNPGTGTFSIMAPEAVPRNYHSAAILLPDGRVFSGGGGLCGSCATNHPDGQIFSPPYLFNADGTLRTRPVIEAAPATAAPGQTISVTTGSPVSSFSMVRYGEATHTVDNDQRRIPLSIVSAAGDTYKLAIPSDPGIALPGPYMLFALDSRGTPSVAKALSIASVAAQPAADPYGRAVLSAGPSLYWPLGDASGPTAADISGNGDTGNYSPAGIAYGAPSPVEGPPGAGVTLDGSSGQIVASQPITNPTTYSEEMWFKTTTARGGYLMGFGSSPTGQSGSRDRQVWMSDNGRLNFGIYVGRTLTITSPAAYNDGKWHQVVATQSHASLDLYVDGKLVRSTAITSLPRNYLGYWRAGGESVAGWPNPPASYYFTGTISDVAFYNSQLPGSEIQAQYKASPASASALGKNGRPLARGASGRLS